MNKFLHGSVLAGVAVLAAAMPLQGQARSDLEQENNIPYGTRSAEFLLLPVSARATALGSAYTAIANDLSAMHYNPAGLVGMQSKGAMLSHLPYVADTRYTWAAVGLPFGGGESAIGFQIGVFGFDDQPIYTIDNPEGTGQTYSVSTSVLGLTYSQQFNDRFSFGLTGKFISEDLAGAKGSTIAADFGTHYQTEVGGKPIRGGFVIQNLGGTLEHRGSDLDLSVPSTDPELPAGAVETTLKTKAWELPAMFRVGVAYDPISSENSRLTLAGEFLQPTQADVGGSLGAEYAMDRIADGPFGIALRGGWNLATDNGLEVDGSELNGQQGDGLSLGGGITYNIGEEAGVGVDYAWRNMGLLGSQSLFSLSVRW